MFILREHILYAASLVNYRFADKINKSSQKIICLSAKANAFLISEPTAIYLASSFCVIAYQL